MKKTDYCAPKTGLVSFKRGETVLFTSVLAINNDYGDQDTDEWED